MMNDTPIPTPRTDEFVTTWDFYNDPFEAIDHAQTLERELTAAQEKIEMLNIRHAAAEMHHANNMGEVMDQRDRLAEALRECREDSVELLGERDWWQLENRGDYQKRYQDTRDNVTRADAALESLNTFH